MCLGNFEDLAVSNYCASEFLNFCCVKLCCRIRCAGPLHDFCERIQEFCITIYSSCKLPRCNAFQPTSADVVTVENGRVIIIQYPSQQPTGAHPTYNLEAKHAISNENSVQNLHANASPDPNPAHSNEDQNQNHNSKAISHAKIHSRYPLKSSDTISNTEISSCFEHFLRHAHTYANEI